jgi:hypothetical protein
MDIHGRIELRLSLICSLVEMDGTSCCELPLADTEQWFCLTVLSVNLERFLLFCLSLQNFFISGPSSSYGDTGLPTYEPNTGRVSLLAGHPCCGSKSCLLPEIM